MRPVISRWQAAEQGLKRFYSGVKCIRGHDAERFTSNGGCVECINVKTPRLSRVGPMAYWPPRALNFGNAKGANVTSTEAGAVYRWMEAAGWHLRALEILRADPELMARFDHDMTIAEKVATGRGVPDPRPSAPAASADGSQ